MSDPQNPEPARASARRGRTRARLLDAAVDVFAERGVEGATVELICERAGFTRGAFYSNFSTKEELLLAAAEHGLAVSLERIEEAVGRLELDPGADHAAQVDALVEHFLGPEDPRGVRIEVELRRLAQDDPQARSLVLRINEHLESRILGVISSIEALGGLRLRAEPIVVVRTLVALHRQAAELAWLTGDGEVDLTLLTSYVMVATEAAD
ncbi:TetR/AcrR family transcriptional regulator [Pseudonocardia lacus]|jgi:AcrR family transcriptional regulator|uniref:TetR/AcrR family transcriptional regulator n=1 Tax=Pseudonocardia lacus TaxID=2835865 RepID=UPI001BDC3504|nr:TetR/AcrR family transcriptional regulator [Pseudonocardia lacus]